MKSLSWHCPTTQTAAATDNAVAEEASGFTNDDKADVDVEVPRSRTRPPRSRTRAAATRRLRRRRSLRKSLRRPKPRSRSSSSSSSSSTKLRILCYVCGHPTSAHKSEIHKSVGQFVGQCYFYVVLSVGRNRPAVTSWRIALETSLNFSSSHKSDSIKKKSIFCGN